ncbi:MAG: phosphoadenylyl-sulfate reductase [Deltaproteobacteria bacterium]|nr:phosphoadenylyl-sulfate reductase [Deltaproteobacteria bacterium]
MTTKVWTPEELKEVAVALEGKPPEDALRWSVDNFKRDEFALACSFAECVTVDMLLKVKPDARVFYLDTGLLFKETYQVVKEVERKYGIIVERYAPDIGLEEMASKHGPELWKTNPDLCCDIRKVRPLKKVLSTLKLWITGLRRDEAPSRGTAPIVGWDEKFNLIKVNPIAAWSRKQVWDYVTKYGVPYNKLLDKGYTSIGCEPCTGLASSDERGGRWPGRAKIECGLHGG